ncbi:MAG TPA: zinc-dependent metalloprotease [Acidimicrobiia bacterium]|nr:zinc-dependent metalloprotease [Acidimicrobiia bacterium]
MDDLFSRLFELFNQPGPVNWKLAGEVARHLAGEPEPVDPWSADEQRELVRLAEYRLEVEAPFPVPPVGEVRVVDSVGWVELALTGFGYLAEAIADAGSAGGAQALPGIGATLAGMQVGSLVGTVSREVSASFETGLPIEPPGPLLVINSGVERVIAACGAVPRDVRLWAAAEEVAHRALFGVPWLTDHLARLAGTYSGHLLPDPEKLMKLWTEDPEGLSSKLSGAGSVADLFANEAAVPHRQALEAFLAVSSGYRHFLVKKALGNLLSQVDSFSSPPVAAAAGLTLPIGRHELTMSGAGFCDEIERRYGREALDGIWQGPERLPTQGELTDPVGWAARVLLADPFV